MKIGSYSIRLVICLDAATGDLVWKQQTEGTTYGVHRKIVACSGTVYVGVEDYLWSFNIWTGALNWKKEVRPGWAITATPEGYIFAGTIDNFLYKISTDGEVLQKIKTDGIFRLESYGNIVYAVSFSDEYEYFKAYSSRNLDLLIDAEIWKRQVIPTLAINERLAMVHAGHTLKALDRKSGKELWTVLKEPDDIVLSGNILAVNDELRDANTGEIIYKYNIPDVRRICLLDDHYIVSDYRGKLYILKVPDSVEQR